MKRVVIADDSSTARMIICRCLKIAGLADAAFIEVDNGREALSKAGEENTDLVVSDLNMPVMDGETFLKWMKSNPKTKDIPVIIITSSSSPAIKSNLMSLGALAVIYKPVSPASILDVLKKIM